MPKNRFIIPLLCAAAIGVACGPWSRGATDEARDGVNKANDAHTGTTIDVAASNDPKRFTSDNQQTKSKDPLVTVFDVTVDDEIHFALHVTNNTDKLTELRFPNGQTHDFAVFDSAGAQVWRWSDGRMFTQALKARMLRSHKTVSFENDWEAGDMYGTFTAVATLNVENQTIEKKVTFTIAPPAENLVALNISTTATK